MLMLMSPASGEHWVTWCARKKDTVLQKEKTCGQAGGLLENGLMDGWNQNRTYCFKSQVIMLYYIYVESYPICETWWYHGLSLKRTLFILGWTIPLRILSHLWNMVVLVSWLESQENVGIAARQQPKNTSHSTKEWLKKNKVNVLKGLSQSLDLNTIKILWKDLSRQFIRGNPPT